MIFVLRMSSRKRLSAAVVPGLSGIGNLGRCTAAWDVCVGATSSAAGLALGAVELDGEDGAFGFESVELGFELRGGRGFAGANGRPQKAIPTSGGGVHGLPLIHQCVS